MIRAPKGPRHLGAETQQALTHGFFRDLPSYIRFFDKPGLRGEGAINLIVANFYPIVCSSCLGMTFN